MVILFKKQVCLLQLHKKQTAGGQCGPSRQAVLLKHSSSGGLPGSSISTLLPISLSLTTYHLPPRGTAAHWLLTVWSVHKAGPLWFASGGLYVVHVLTVTMLLFLGNF